MRLPNKQTTQKFQNLVLTWHEEHGRHELPWRQTSHPYAIMVSEVMLQQTQVVRVIPKYKQWLKAFPTVEALAQASVKEVLTHWQGLGYNRRGLNFKRAAEVIVREHGGQVPSSLPELLLLPGIGPYTAAAIRAFAFNQTDTVIETNIRAVYLKHFFPKENKVSDKELAPVIAATLPAKVEPRVWYAALMDYGAHLKATEGNHARRSKHHVKQSTFKGSNRENRAAILKLVLAEGLLTPSQIIKTLKDARTEANLEALIAEGFLRRVGKRIAAAE